MEKYFETHTPNPCKIFLNWGLIMDRTLDINLSSYPFIYAYKNPFIYV